MESLSCYAAYASGGLGQHFSDLVERVRERSQLRAYFTTGPREGDSRGVRVQVPPFNWYTRLLLRSNTTRRLFLPADRFDQAVAAMLDAPITAFTGFGAQSAHSFRRARELGCERLQIVAACSHVNNVRRRHDDAIRRYPFESSWMGEDYRLKSIEEYRLADVIFVASEYTRQTFLREGIAESKLVRFNFRTDPRFKPASGLARELRGDGTFRIVYTGSVTVMKGVPVLIDAISRINDPRLELTLVGGSGTRGMRKYLEWAVKRDPRIHIRPGDPLPHLQCADVYVHPSFEDGHAYAPMEAMACGVPVIVSEDTGMKEHVREGETGYVVPTGDVDALVDRLQRIRRGELKRPLEVGSTA